MQSTKLSEHLPQKVRIWLQNLECVIEYTCLYADWLPKEAVHMTSGLNTSPAHAQTQFIPLQTHTPTHTYIYIQSVHRTQSNDAHTILTSRKHTCTAYYAMHTSISLYYTM